MFIVFHLLQISGVNTEHYVWQCYESGSVPFILDLLIFIYLGLLQFVGIILAFQTRKVKINVLNDSKSVTALIYISSISCIANALIAFTSRGYINVRVGVFSGLTIFLATTFLAIIFIPKVGLAFYIYMHYSTHAWDLDRDMLS